MEQMQIASHRGGGLRWHEQTKAYAERRKAEGLSNKDILRCLKRFIAREVFHLLMGKPPRRTTAS
jgi:transposase